MHQRLPAVGRHVLERVAPARNLPRRARPSRVHGSCRDVENLLTIDQGVDAQATASSDLDPGGAPFASDSTFAAYAVPPAGTALGGTDATGTSGVRGFFDIEPASGP